MSTMSIPSSIEPGSTKMKDFVFKLRLVSDGGTGTAQIRRVRLPLIQVDGQVSYEALVGIAISFSFPRAVAENYDVIMTYYDIDNDCVTIASTEELLDAIDQFACLENPVLRISTDVKKKEASGQFTTASTRSSSTSTSGGDKVPTTSPSVTPLNGKPKQLQNLVESFVSIVATAVVNLQHQVAEAHPNTTQPRASSSTTAHVTDKKESNTAENLAKEVVTNIEMNEADERTEANSEAQENAAGEHLFIHGRHTCDGCLCTPIIGTRFHSSNLPDYDLCAKCRGNYKGTEIQFDAAELDRDKPFQERWQRKRARFAERVGRVHEPDFRGPLNCHPFRGPHGRRRGGHFRWQQASMDAALKEAIRRSLQDVKEESTPTPSTPNEVTTSVSIEAAQSEASTKASVVTEEERSTKELTTMEDANAIEIAEEAIGDSLPSNHTTESMQDVSFSSEAIGHGDVAESLGKTLDECAQVIDFIVSELDRDQKVVSSEYYFDDEDDLAVLLECNAEEEYVSGDNIVDGEEVVEEEVNDNETRPSEDEWEVVVDDEQIASDEMIARAAQMIGSALFQSDLRSLEGVEGGTSTLTNSGSFGERLDSLSDSLSVPSFVPSLSVISIAVLDRWALQLSQLHELGFSDDKTNVDILERLNAANIGVDEDDEISVTQAVNALLKQE